MSERIKITEHNSFDKIVSELSTNGYKMVRFDLLNDVENTQSVKNIVNNAISQIKERKRALDQMLNLKFKKFKSEYDVSESAAHEAATVVMLKEYALDEEKPTQEMLQCIDIDVAEILGQEYVEPILSPKKEIKPVYIQGGATLRVINSEETILIEEPLVIETYTVDSKTTDISFKHNEKEVIVSSAFAIF